MQEFTDAVKCIEWIESQRRGKGEKNIENMRNLCHFFNDPQDSYKIIHVAGTNGKGSVVQYFANVLKEANYKVGTFTSPYIDCFNERIQYNKHYIPSNYLLKYTNYIISKYDELDKQNIERPSFFALITLIAFMFFKDMNVDVAVVEVGIGGKLDDTNVVNPVLTVISNVSFDHMNVLGNTIEEIASNKLGILKDHIPFVTIQNDDIKQLIKEKCFENYAPYTIVKKNNIQNVRIGLGQTIFDYLEYKDVHLHMSGLYQTENASIVIEGVRYLNSKGFNITKDNVYNGLNKTFWLGRLEIVSKKPIIILDGAHNVDAITRLMEYIKTIKHSHKVRLILAISANKDKEHMLDLIDDNIDELILSTFNYKRSDEGINLYNISNHKNKILENDINKIFEIISNDSMINIFSGSLYFVSEIRKIIKFQKK